MRTGLVLAAGAGSRMGGPKAGITVGGVRLLDRAIAALREGGCDEVVAVVRPGVQAEGARLVVNPQPERGMRSSLALGVAAARTAEVVVSTLVDLPGVTPEVVRAVMEGWVGPERVAVGWVGDATHGQQMHPVVMAPRLWEEALALAGEDEGARLWMRAHPELVDRVPLDADPSDLDTPEDLFSLRNRAHGSRASRPRTEA